MACGLWYTMRMKNNPKQYVLYAKAGTLQKTRKKIAQGSLSWLKVGVMHDRIDSRKVGIVSKDFWENVLHCR